MLADFTTDQLRAELALREQTELESKRDRNPRKFYRKVDRAFANERERAKFIAGLGDDVKFETKKDDIFLLDAETPEEVATRLSRSATIDYDYDHFKLRLYEGGKKVGEQGLDGPYDSYAAEWESRPPKDSKYNDCEWGEDKAKGCLGYSARPADWYRY